MGRLVLATVGFDEKLVLRSLLKLGLDKDDVLALVYSKTGSSYDVERVKKAVGFIKELSSTTGVTCVDVVVSTMDFVDDVGKILDVLKEYAKDREIVASLVGSMRLVIVEVLVALMLYKRFVYSEKTIMMHVMREDGMYDIILPFDVVYLPTLSSREVDVLRIIASKELENTERPRIVETLARDLNVTEYMIYKILSGLEKKGVITIEDNTLKLTTLGKLVIKVIT